jgi:hypothetical protein
LGLPSFPIALDQFIRGLSVAAISPADNIFHRGGGDGIFHIGIGEFVGSRQERGGLSVLAHIAAESPDIDFVSSAHAKSGIDYASSIAA